MGQSGSPHITHGQVNSEDHRKASDKHLRCALARLGGCVHGHPLQPALQQYTTKSCCIGQYSARALSRAHCGAIQLYSAMQHTAIHRSTVYSTLQFGPDTGFCWVRVRFLETSSSPRPSDFREISGKSVIFFSPSADRPSAMVAETVVTVARREKMWIQPDEFWYEPRRCPENGLDKFLKCFWGVPAMHRTRQEVI